MESTYFDDIVSTMFIAYIEIDSLSPEDLQLLFGVFKLFSKWAFQKKYGIFSFEYHQTRNSNGWDGLLIHLMRRKGGKKAGEIELEEETLEMRKRFLREALKGE